MLAAWPRWRRRRARARRGAGHRFDRRVRGPRARHADDERALRARHRARRFRSPARRAGHAHAARRGAGTGGGDRAGVRAGNERDAADPRARALAAEIDKTRADIKAKEARKATITSETEDVGAFGEVFASTLAEDMRNPRPDTPAWGKTFDGLRARRAALADERRKLDVALRALQLTLGNSNGSCRRWAAATASARIAPPRSPSAAARNTR